MRYKKNDKGLNVCEEGIVYLPQLKEPHNVKNMMKVKIRQSYSMILVKKKNL